MSNEAAPRPTHAGAQIIDLVALVAPVRQLLAFYDDLVADRTPRIDDLHEALVQLQELNDIPGPLGRDIDLMAGGGQGASPQHIVESLHRLRRVAALDPEPRTIATTGHPATREPCDTRRPGQSTPPGVAND